MRDHELRLVLQVALLGEVGPALRGVAYGQSEDGVTLHFYLDGPISAADRESAACVVTEVLAALPPEVRVSEELIRCDHPARVPTDLRLVFRRRE
jgi:hypothetical protein